MNASRRSVLASLGLAFAFAFAPLGASAAEKADVTVHVVQASKKPGKNDPRLERFRKQLGDFAYKNYQLLSVKKISVEKGQSQTVSLEGGKKLTVNFRSIDKDGRARLKLTIPGVVESTVAVRPGGDVVLGGNRALNTYTFNFDDLLTQAIEELGSRVSGATRIPPDQRGEVMHLHGKLLPDGTREGDLILSERDFHRAASGDDADTALRELLKRRDVLLVGLSLTDPRLRRQLLVRQGWSEKRKVFVLLPDSRSTAVSDFVERLSHGLVRRHETRFWADWNLDVGYVPGPELVAVHQRCIRLGGSAANWAVMGARFLERSSPVYSRLYELQFAPENPAV